MRTLAQLSEHTHRYWHKLSTFSKKANVQITGLYMVYILFLRVNKVRALTPTEKVKTQTLRWLTVYVNLSGLRDAEVSDKTWFSGGSMRMFPEDTSISIGRLSKENILTPHPHAGGRHSAHRGPEQHRKASERWICSLPKPGYWHYWLSGLWTQARTLSVPPHSQAFRLGLDPYHRLS